MASIILYKTRLDFPSSGGTIYVQVDYTGAKTINEPTCSQSWVTIKKTMEGFPADGSVQHKYSITMQPTSFARNVKVVFSCVDSSGNVITEDNLMLWQAGPNIYTKLPIYVNNGPIVMPYESDTKYISIEIGGDAFVDGYKIDEFITTKTNVDWLTIEYDEEQYEDGYYYSFDLSTTTNSSIYDRTAICILQYVLDDGTYGESTFNVIQEGNNGIKTNIENPIVFTASCDEREVVTVEYIGLDGEKLGYINPIQISGPFSSEKIRWRETADGYAIDYEIRPLYCNVERKEIEGSVTFGYINPNTNRLNTDVLYIRQMGVRESFGITYEEEKIPNNIIDFIISGSYSITLSCNYPYIDNASPKISIVQEYPNTAQLETSTEDIYNGVKEGYFFDFNDNNNYYTRYVDLTVEYTSIDGVKHKDTVRLIQDSSDGYDVVPQIIPLNDKIKFNYDGSAVENNYIEVRWFGEFSSKNFNSSVDWVRIGEPLEVGNSGTYNKVIRYPITIYSNDTDTYRIANINFYGEGKSKVIGVYQASKDKDSAPIIPVDGDDYCGPIWKDVEYDFGNIYDVNYNVFADDVLIFSGKSCRRPNTEHNTILINKICQNYMDAPLYIDNHSTNYSGYNVFKLTNEDGRTYRTYRFVNDWSYSNEFKTGVLSHPILNDRTVVRGQMLPFTVFGAANDVEIPYGIIYDGITLDKYGDIINDEHYTVSAKNNVITEFFPYDETKEGAVSYYINNEEWKVIDDCKVEYVLYYINPWGGFDWFPIKGKVTEIDDITQYVYTQNYNNTTLEFGKKRYLSEINKKYQLNTHWLREDESMRMWYLLQSNTVYMHNIKTNKMYPVIITATQQEHKKRGIVSSRIQYQIEVELSQMRERI